MKFKRRHDYVTLIEELHQSVFSQIKSNWQFNSWPIIKNQVGYFLHILYIGKIKEEDYVNHSGTPVFAARHISDLFRLTKYWIICQRLKKKWDSSLKDKTLLVSWQSQNNSQGINIYIDPFRKLLDQISEDSLLLETDVDEKGTLSEFYSALCAYYSVRSRLKKSFSIEMDKARYNSDLVFSFLENKMSSYSKVISSAVFENIVYNEIYYSAYIDFLQTIQPKLIWMYNYYENNHLALSRAANKLNIPIVEYQHSVIAASHFAYSKWWEIDQYAEFFPSKFWVWDTSSENIYKEDFTGYKYIPQMIVGGNLYILDKLKNIPPTPSDKKKNKILICLQGEWIPEYIEDFIVENNDYAWYIRLHPRYPDDKEKLIALKERFPDKIECEIANSLPLYDLLTKVEYNLTSFSGTALEAYMLGVKNIICGLDGYDTYKSQIDAKIFGYIQSKEDLVSLLNHPHFFNESNILDIDTETALKQLYD